MNEPLGFRGHFIREQNIHRYSVDRLTVGTCDHEIAGSIPGSGRNSVTTMGKSITPACLDADSIGYCMESLNGYLYLSVGLWVTKDDALSAVE